MRVFLSSYIAPNPCYLDWRKTARDLLELRGMEVIDPIQGVDPANWDHAGLIDTATTPAFMVANDLRKLEMSDALLLYAFANLPRQSIGTWFEFAWAVRARKPVIVVSEDRTIIHHPFIQRFATEIVPSVEEGVEWLVRLT